MTTELTISKEGNGAASAGMALFRSLMDNVGLHEHAAAYDNTGISDKHTLEREGWQRSLSATIALLKYAHDLLERAEETVLRQDRRIAQLEILATTDELTGLKNRRGFYEAFTAELDRANRGISAGGLLVLIDLDNFKAVNDTHGHLAGDACLRLVARSLANEIRPMDAAARLGGDEFVLLLSNTTQKEAASRAQQLGWRLNNLSLAWYGDTIPVRASLGLRGYGKGDRPDKVFNAADCELYDSKRQRHAEGDEARA